MHDSLLSCAERCADDDVSIQATKELRRLNSTHTHSSTDDFTSADVPLILLHIPL